MTDIEIYELLRRIDDGYLVTEKEKKVLESVNSIRWQNISQLPQCMGLLSSLTKIDLSENLLLGDISSLAKLRKLKTLNLSVTDINDLDSLSGLVCLEELILQRTWVCDISPLSNLVNLKVLDLSRNRNISEINALSHLTALTNLSLQRTGVYDISGLSGLTNLKIIDLRMLKIISIPESFLDLQLDFITNDFIVGPGIYIYGLTTIAQPIEIFSQSRNLIIEYYKSLKRKMPINECKVVFLGDGGAGKSLLIERLMRDGKEVPDFDGESTPGIKITSKKYLINGEEINLHFWDFGGQAIMHSMHRLFLTNRTLYIVVANARDNKANDQAWYWIRNIKSFANGAPVLLMVNQIDQNPSANVNETGIRKEYPNLKGVCFASALRFTPEQFNNGICNVILNIVSQMDSVHALISQPWLSLMNDLQEMPTDYITSKVFYSMCNKNGIGTEQEVLDLIISLYQDLGVCFYSKRHPVSSQYMVLKPRWLLNALYIIAFNGRRYAVNGIIDEKAIYKIICEPVSYKDIKKVWPDIEYETDEIQYIINVLLNYNLVYRIDNERLFIPMLCDENEPDIIDSYKTGSSVHVSFRYAYLPENVLHSLMVLRGYELNKDVVWKTGAVFERKRCGWEALVRIRDNCLDIYAKASDQETHPIISYLDMIREPIYRINADFGLDAVEYISYFQDGEKDEFEFKTLEGSRKSGLNVIYSKVFDRLVSIDDIIGAITSPELLYGSDNEDAIQALLIALYKALSKLQKNRLYYDEKENKCNSYVRDLLEQSGYICKDETRQGTSETNMNDGELDILIKEKDREDDLTIFEGLRLTLKSFGDSDKKRVSDHLEKLIKNYNPTGLTNLFLVSYVSWRRERFDGLADEYGQYVFSDTYAPYTIIEGRLMDFISSTYLRCYKVGYDCGKIKMYVYHFIVRVAV